MQGQWRELSDDFGVRSKKMRMLKPNGKCQSSTNRQPTTDN